MRLIEISGIGPKMAMQILGGYDLKTLTVAIASGDSKTLCKIKGLGKKTAELIILSLRDQVADDITLFNDHRDAVTGEDIADAVFALESLGISKPKPCAWQPKQARRATAQRRLFALACKNEQIALFGE